MTKLYLDRVHLIAMGSIYSPFPDEADRGKVRKYEEWRVSSGIQDEVVILRLYEDNELLEQLKYYRDNGISPVLHIDITPYGEGIDNE